MARRRDTDSEYILGRAKVTSIFSAFMTCQMAEWEIITPVAHSEDPLCHGERTPLIFHILTR